MISHKAFYAICLVWFFGWGVLLLKFPNQCYRAMSLGREPSARNLKTVKVVGYMGLGFGSLLVIELVAGIVH